MATKTQKPSVKRSICIPKPLDRFVMKMARDKALPLGKRPNYSDALADMVIRARTEEAGA